MIDWAPLRRELALWRREGVPLPIWWRDDDATDSTPELDQLLTIAEKIALPVHLAVIPRDATMRLAGRCATSDLVVPLVHGWAHQSHAPAGQKKAEFNSQRPDAISDAAAGITQMKLRFGTSCAPIFVPPWNRISDHIVKRLPSLGYAGLSTFTPRTAKFAAPGLTQINTHIDPIDWRGSRSLLDPGKLIEVLVQILQERRNGHTDASEPLGFLTHHLVHDPAIWSFTEACLSELLAGGATPCNLMSYKGKLP